jgi:hypothetical protein
VLSAGQDAQDDVDSQGQGEDGQGESDQPSS